MYECKLVPTLKAIKKNKSQDLEKYHFWSFLNSFQCLRKWGFRRCEDICWIKTNKNNPGKTKAMDPKAVFQRTKV